MMTGIIKPDIEKQTFRTYILWFTLANQAVAYLVTSTYWSTAANPSIAVAALIWATVTWTWIGGTLDFLYWMMAGRIPEWEKISSRIKGEVNHLLTGSTDSLLSN